MRRGGFWSLGARALVDIIMWAVVLSVAAGILLALEDLARSVNAF